ncbi:MAG: cytochrome oxidase putative small subunit CydP [Porticoccaceae bacterium]|jgi:hypothetical protein|uniref:cytochrome oxidase putative small subunit CydP n=1 Tax=Hydrogenophaga sp. TaxID=1904254 RepID=UPI00262936F2|nr:cytochrome oxidase putative small subunit CydP [Hydrogenophaga sp.]MDD3785623.1 hypothetical protein [Hydrogenophaga sp.]
MNAQDRILLRKLTWTVLIKLVALSMLWWLFVHDAQVAVDESAAARQLLTPTVSTTQE